MALFLFLIGFTAQSAQFTISMADDKYTLGFTANKAEFSSYSQKSSVSRQACNAAFIDSISSPFIRLYALEKEASKSVPKHSVIEIKGDKGMKKRIRRNSPLGQLILSLPAMFSGVEVQSKWRCG